MIEKKTTIANVSNGSKNKRKVIIIIITDISTINVKK